MDCQIRQVLLRWYHLSDLITRLNVETLLLYYVSPSLRGKYTANALFLVLWSVYSDSVVKTSSSRIETLFQLENISSNQFDKTQRRGLPRERGIHDFMNDFFQFHKLRRAILYSNEIKIESAFFQSFIGE